MKHTSIGIEEFIKKASLHLVVDVRSPGEYNHARIPGAISMPLFDDTERTVVGTAYKQQSREKAIKLGLDYFGPKMRLMIEQMEKVFGMKEGDDPSKYTVLVYCWRGGMRSGGVAWLLSLYGFEVLTLKGGYKAFRNWILLQFAKPYPFKILSGYTGAGKTEILNDLVKNGEHVIDLESLANHKGSAFGHIGMGDQPSQEMFENQLGMELCKKRESSGIWLEDESRRIGHVNIPVSLWERMCTSPMYFVDAPFENRLNHIVKEYGNLEKEQLMHGIMRIQKRLGGLATKTAINHLLDGQIKESFAILLAYYDKYYQKNLDKKKMSTKIHSIEHGENMLEQLLMEMK